MKPARTIDADLCVVGSGVAGMICAIGAARRDARIVVVERGTRTPLAESVRRLDAGRYPFARGALANTHVVNRGRHEHAVPTENAVGGSTLRWWGHAPRLDPSDFALASRHGVGVDWPIGYDELEPYLLRAEHELAISGDGDDCPWPRSGPYPHPAHPLSPHERIIASALEAIGLPVQPMPLGRLSRAAGGRPPCCGSATCSIVCPTDAKYTALNTHVPAAERTGRVEIVEALRANALVAEGGRIAALRCQDATGAEVHVRARRFVLAGNGVENPRLLLASALVDPAFVASPHTGRHFMDHPHVMAVGTSARDLRRGYGPTPSGGMSWALYEGPWRRERAAGLVELVNLPRDARAAADAAAAGLARGLRGDDLRRHVQAADRTFYVGFQMELLPDPANRVALSATAKDPFGWPSIEITYDAWPDYVARAADHWRGVAQQLAARLDARVTFTERHESRHLIGTCRMGRSIEDSVVDRDLRYHAYENLYVLGSSAFPTGGAANPTLLIAALALRLGDHLAG